jgi:iron complex outermembrane receptor protein
LFGPSSQGFTSTATFQGYNAAGATTTTFAGQGHSQTGSNPNLGPSTSENFSGGFVYSPKQVKGLTFTADYFHVNEYNIVGTIGATTIIQSVEKLGAASPYANKVRLAPLGAANDPKWFTQGAAITNPGQISALGLDSTYVVDTNINLGGYKTDGADVRINYTKVFESVGRFDVGTVATIYKRYEYKNLLTDPYFDYANTVSGIYSTIPQWRTYTTIAFTRGSLRALLAHTFVPTVTDVTTNTQVGSYSQLDARIAYTFTTKVPMLKGMSLAFDVNNVFNKFGPPSPSNTDSHVDTAIYGAIGRQFTLELGYKF